MNWGAVLVLSVLAWVALFLLTDDEDDGNRNGPGSV